MHVAGGKASGGNSYNDSIHIGCDNVIMPANIDKFKTKFSSIGVQHTSMSANGQQSQVVHINDAFMAYAFEGYCFNAVLDCLNVTVSGNENKTV